MVACLVHVPGDVVDARAVVRVAVATVGTNLHLRLPVHVIHHQRFLVRHPPVVDRVVPLRRLEFYRQGIRRLRRQADSVALRGAQVTASLHAAHDVFVPAADNAPFVAAVIPIAQGQRVAGVLVRILYRTGVAAQVLRRTDVQVVRRVVEKHLHAVFQFIGTDLGALCHRRTEDPVNVSGTLAVNRPVAAHVRYQVADPVAFVVCQKQGRRGHVAERTEFQRGFHYFETRGI